jgi:hypothetical protein
MAEQNGLNKVRKTLYVVCIPNDTSEIGMTGHIAMWSEQHAKTYIARTLNGQKDAFIVPVPLAHILGPVVEFAQGTGLDKKLPKEKAIEFMTAEVGRLAYNFLVIDKEKPWINGQAQEYFDHDGIGRLLMLLCMYLLNDATDDPIVAMFHEMGKRGFKLAREEFGMQDEPPAEDPQSEPVK